MSVDPYRPPPRPDGAQSSTNALSRLRAIGEWMRLHSRSIYGCTESEFAPPPDCRYTQNGKRLYLHLFAWPFRHVHLDGLAGRAEYAQLLGDASEVRLITPGADELHNNTSVKGRPDSVILELPVRKPDAIVPVVEIFLK